MVIVRMVVVVTIKRQHAPGPMSEKRAILGCRCHHLGPPFTADVSVQTNHPVGRRHHHVQVVADHDHRRTGGLSDLFDQPVKCRGAWVVEPVCGFVKHKDIRRAPQCAGQHDALQLAPGKRCDLHLANIAKADLRQCLGCIACGSAAGQVPKRRATVIGIVVSNLSVWGT